MATIVAVTDHGAVHLAFRHLVKPSRLEDRALDLDPNRSPDRRPMYTVDLHSESSWAEYYYRPVLEVQPLHPVLGSFPQGR